jgi:hypothetical protein
MVISLISKINYSRLVKEKGVAMKNKLFVVTTVLGCFLCSLSCSLEKNDVASETQKATYVNSLEDLEIVKSQVVFVPAYSEIYVSPNKTIPMIATVGIHNTDTEETIVIKSVRQYDTSGQLLKEFVEKPLLLSPIASKAFVGETTGKGSGIGANFIVEWVAEKAVQEPVIEAVMTNRVGTTGFSLISPGRIISETK